jgi:hypothetical protein
MNLLQYIKLASSNIKIAFYKKSLGINILVGENCKYKDIKTALDSIKFNSRFIRYTVTLLNGNYDISNDGNNFLGFKNYVDIVGQSKEHVIITKRESEYSSLKAGFDPFYYKQKIKYASLRNLTIITYNCKSPVHIDGEQLKGTIEIINCNLINENEQGKENYENSLACGLRYNQRVICRQVYGNGMLWAHNWNRHYTGEGCHFELYNCTSKFIQVGDLLSYGHDIIVVEGCKTEFLRLVYYKNFGGELDYIIPSYEFRLQNNSFNDIREAVTMDGGYNISENNIELSYT